MMVLHSLLYRTRHLIALLLYVSTQSRCGCKIQIDQNFPEGHPRKITFTGSADAVALGIYMVQQVMEHGPSVTMFSAPGMPQPMPGMPPAAQPYGMPAAVDPAPVGVPSPGVPMPTRDGTVSHGGVSPLWYGVKLD